jgi:hypothetical protein
MSNKIDTTFDALILGTALAVAVCIFAAFV